MRTERKNVSSYLIIGCCHLGMTPSIIGIMKQVKDFYKAKTIHLGSVSTQEEIKMYEARVGRVKTWEKQQKQLESMDKTECLTYENLLDKIQKTSKEISSLCNAQKARIDYLKTNLDEDMTFVVNDEQKIPTRELDEILEMRLCKHLIVSSVSANGDRVCHSPITPRSFNYFRIRSRSFIVPHPTPALRSFNKEGLNQACEMMTTGSLKEIPEIKRPSELYKIANMPAAVLVMIDEDSGEFHLKRLMIDSYQSGITKTYFVCDDGMVFFSKKTIEVGTTDRATASSDDHSPFEHMGVLASLINLNDLFWPATFVNMGDASNCTSFCRHNKGKPLLNEGLRCKDDIYNLKKLLSAQTSNSCIKRRVLVASNHHDWLSRFIEENPCLVGILDWASVRKQHFANWEFHLREENIIFKFGDLTIRHGDREAGMLGGAKVFKKSISGHWHSHNEFMWGYSVGAGCHLDPSYLEGGMTSWTNTITTMTQFSGHTSANIKTVLHDDERKVSRFAFRNKIYEVPFHSYE